jgi:hypothetical protein
VLKTYIAEEREREREKNKRLPSFWENIWSLFIGRKCAAQSRAEEEEEEESARNHFVAHEMKLCNEMKRPENNKNRAGPHDELRSSYAITEKEKSV